MLITADQRTDGEVELAIAADHRLLCEIQRRVLSNVAEHDRREAWRAHGATSEAKYLQADFGLGWRTASAWVRVAHALDRRPMLAEHFAEGTFSFDHVCGLVDVMAAQDAATVAPAGPFDTADGGESDTVPDGSSCDDPLVPTGQDADDTGAGEPADPGTDALSPTDGRPSADGLSPTDEPSPDGVGSASGGVSDDELIELGNRMTAAQLAALARRQRQRSADQDAAAHRRRRIVAWLDAEDAHLPLRGDLFGLQAQHVWAALMDFATTCSANPATNQFDPLEIRFADALDAMATAYLEGRSHVADRPAVIVHADAAIVDGGEGWAMTSSGVPLASETVRRLLCFCDLTAVLDDKLGNPLQLGRTKRTPTWQLAAMVRRRDGGCRFPGCNRTLWVQVHHILEWEADKGRTDYENLLCLCSYHHHLVHEGGWRMSGDACGEVRFTDRFGTMSLSSWADPAPPPSPGRRPDPPDPPRGRPDAPVAAPDQLDPVQGSRESDRGNGAALSHRTMSGDVGASWEQQDLFVSSAMQPAGSSPHGQR